MQEKRRVVSHGVTLTLWFHAEAEHEWSVTLQRKGRRPRVVLCKTEEKATQVYQELEAALRAQRGRNGT